jgi:hypothetical protein
VSIEIRESRKIGKWQKKENERNSVHERETKERRVR